MRRASVIAATLLLAAGCKEQLGNANRMQGVPPRTDPRPFRIVLSGDTRGFIVPCGCTSKQFGGFPRRATYLSQLPADGLLYVDAGGSLHRATDYDRLKAEFLWRGMSDMNVIASNLGASEIALGRDFIESENRKYDHRFVSTNVVSAEGAKAVVDAERRVAGGRARIAFLGICSMKYPPGPGLKVLDPLEALREPITRIRAENDVVILLAHAPEEELAALATAFPELDAVLATGPSQPIPPRMIEGRTVLAGASNKGKFLVTIPWAPVRERERTRWLPGQGEIVELAESYADAPRMVDLVKQYQRSLRETALPPEKTGETAPLLPGLPADFRYAGSEACAKCHTPESAIWTATKHAHGYETIVGKGFEADPFCIRCHTTGYGGPGGYRSAADAPKLGGIGCESCHGPAQAHVAAPLKSRTPMRALDACLGCHDPENSPTFAVAAFWPRIAHGKGRSPQPVSDGGERR